jgi:amino acid permease
MTADTPGFFSREELLGGLPARRASTVLFATEARTAHLVVRSKRAMAYYLTERTAADREQAFLRAMAGGRELPIVPRIQDLERYAGEWAPLVPDDAPLRATIADMLGKKYRFTADLAPRIRAALALDEPATEEAYRSLHRSPLGSIYAERLPATERFRWFRSRLAARIEALPPFWMAYALTLTETVGGGLLVLPIALAGIGPLPGVAVLVLLGLLNILTIGGLVEAITRNGTMRYGNAYFGRLAGALLGRSGSSSITLTLLAFNVVMFLAYLLAFGSAVGAATGTSALIWVGVLFLVNLFFLRRRDLDSTVATAIVIGAVNVGLIFAIAALAMTHMRADNVLAIHLPFVGSNPAGAAVLGLVFGVVLMAYFGHTSVGNVARVVLERDPSGTALLRGTVAATASVIVLYSLAVVAINGAVDRSALLGFGGTAIEPLADEVGSSVSVLGAIYVTLALGLGSIYISLGMFNQVREWLPTADGGSASRRAFARFASGSVGGFWLGVLPSFLTFALVEWLVSTDRASFAEPLSLIGTLTLPVLGGIFPMLLLAASRRRGDYVPESVVRALGGRASIPVVALIFFAAVLVQGFVIWQRPVERLLSGVAAGLMLLVGAVAARRGAFRPRSVIEIRREPSGSGVLTVTVEGRPADAVIRVAEDGTEREIRGPGGPIDSFDAVRWASFELPRSDARQLKVWVHGVTADGDSEPIDALVRLEPDTDADDRPTRSGDGAVVLELADPAARVLVTLDGAAT